MENNSNLNEILHASSQLFLQISTTENHIETIRQRLSNTPSFDYLHIFLSFDKQNNNRISADDLLSFLNDQGSKSNIELLNHAVLFYDEDKDGYLSYSEFETMLLSNEDYSLRRAAKDKLWSNDLSKPVDKRVCNILIELVESEVYFIKELISIINQLKQIKGFSIKFIFDILQINGCITPSSLMKLFTTFYPHTTSFDDVSNVMKRLDFNKDNKIDYNEFSQLFNISNAYHSNKLIQNSKNASTRSELTNSTSNLNVDYSFNSDRHQSLFIPINNNEDNDNDSLKLRIAPSLKHNSFQGYSINNEDSLLRFLLTVIDIELALEKEKFGLVLQDDFNIEALFRLFKLNSHLDILYPNDISDGMSFFNIAITDKDNKMFFRRFNLSQKNFINYAEFFDIFIPFEKEFKDMIENKTMTDYLNNKPQLFEFKTHQMIKDLITHIFEYENHLETIRSTFSFNTLQQSITNLFNSIDHRLKHYISSKDIFKYLNQEKNINCTMRGCNLLQIRLDKNRNGKVEQWELINEYLPLYCFTHR